MVAMELVTDRTTREPAGALTNDVLRYCHAHGLVLLKAGLDDNVIPAVESDLLAEHLKGHTRVRRLQSGFLTHVDVSTHPSAEETLEMIAFWKAALGER